MDLGPLFPGMVNTVGALLPALISLGLVVTGRTRSRLSTGDQFWLGVFSLTVSAVLARVSVTAAEVSLHMPPGATLFVCYLVWRGYYISPGLAFALTYTSTLPVDVSLAQLATGSEFSFECIGGAGWHDGLLVFPTLTALAVGYANWRMAHVGHAGLFWFGQRTGKLAPEPAHGNLARSLPVEPMLRSLIREANPVVPSDPRSEPLRKSPRQRRSRSAHASEQGLAARQTTTHSLS